MLFLTRDNQLIESRQHYICDIVMPPKGMIEVVISLTVSVHLSSILELCQTSFLHNGQLLVCTTSLFACNLRAQALIYLEGQPKNYDDWR